MMRRHHHSYERDTTLGCINAAFIFMQFKFELRKIADNLGLDFPQLCFVSMKDNEVVHVAQIAAAPEPFFDEVVQSIKIDVRNKLTGQIADRYTAGCKFSAKSECDLKIVSIKDNVSI